MTFYYEPSIRHKVNTNWMVVQPTLALTIACIIHLVTTHVIHSLFQSTFLSVFTSLPFHKGTEKPIQI